MACDEKQIARTVIITDYSRKTGFAVLAKMFPFALQLAPVLGPMRNPQP